MKNLMSSLKKTLETLELDMELWEKNEIQEKSVAVNSVEQLKHYVGGTEPLLKTSKKIASDYDFSNSLTVINDYLSGEINLCQRAESVISSLLPLTVNVQAKKSYIIDKTIKLTNQAATRFLFEKLTFIGEAQLITESTAIIIDVDEIDVSESTADYHMIFTGTSGVSGECVPPGSNGPNGIDGSTESGERGGKGTNGKPGSAGENAEHGSDGGDCLLTQLYINKKILGKLKIITCPGAGGNGGDGGAGGKGGKGGNGGKSTTPSCTSYGGGNGGNGGAAGNGGNAGNGGDSGKANPLIIQIGNEELRSLIQVDKEESEKSNAGQVGAAGGSGAKGKKGSSTCCSGTQDGKSGSDGKAGDEGKSGAEGKAGELLDPKIANEQIYVKE
jgi:hypothetical protein